MALALAMLLCFGFLAACGAATTSEASLPPEVSIITPIINSDGKSVLTGLQRAEDVPENQRPIAIMVANSQSSLPQKGIAAADVLYEMVTEGGITRLMAVYDDFATVPAVGPVRSIRDQFVQLAVPYNFILAHIGSSTYANNLLNVLAYQNIDGIYLGKTSFYFDETQKTLRARENNYYTDAGLLWAGMERMDVHTTGELSPIFNFTENSITGETPAISMDIVFSPNSNSSFAYNAETGVYAKNYFGAPHADADGTPLAFKNVFVFKTGITLKPDGNCTEFDFTSGKGTYFVNGTAQTFKWEKGTPTEPLLLFDKNGAPLLVEAGKSYISFIAKDESASLTVHSGEGEPTPSA